MPTPDVAVLKLIPALTPPSGKASNLINSPNPFFAKSIVTWTICTFAVIVCVGIHLFTKCYIMKKPDWTVGLTVIAAFGNFAYMSISITEMTLGSGQHLWNVSIADAMHLAYWSMVQTAVYSAALIFSKACVIVPLIRIFSPTRRGFYYWTIWGLLICTTLFYIAAIPVVLLACSPRERIWNPFTEGSCIRIDVAWLTYSVWNVVVDIFIVILPLFVICHLHLPMKNRLGLSIIFATTLFVLAASVARLYYTILIVNEEDKTYYSRPVDLWGNAEMATLICCSSMPVMPRFYRWVLDKDETEGSNARPVMSSYRQRTGKHNSTTIAADAIDSQKLQSLHSARSHEFSSGELSFESLPHDRTTGLLRITIPTEF